MTARDDYSAMCAEIDRLRDENNRLRIAGRAVSDEMVSLVCRYEDQVAAVNAALDMHGQLTTEQQQHQALHYLRLVAKAVER